MEHFLLGLVRKDREANVLRTRLAQIGADLGHVDAVIGTLDPDQARCRAFCWGRCGAGEDVRYGGAEHGRAGSQARAEHG